MSKRVSDFQALGICLRRQGGVLESHAHGTLPVIPHPSHPSRERGVVAGRGDGSETRRMPFARGRGGKQKKVVLQW